MTEFYCSPCNAYTEADCVHTDRERMPQAFLNGVEYVPLSVSQSRIVTWLWRHTSPHGWLHYKRAVRLARRLP